MSISPELLARIASLPWHHSIDLGEGVITRGNKSRELCESESMLIFDRVNLNGRSVLDIGAWNGYFSFEAKRRGASRVLATDSYCWAHPHIKGRETFEIARELLNFEVEALEIDAEKMTPDEVGQFDVVLFLGVFYHRYDAIEVLGKVARLVKELLIVETHLDLRNVGSPAMIFYPGRELANDPTNWWAPNEQCMTSLLRGHGFNDIEVAAHPAGPNRAIFHAWRRTDARLRHLPEQDRLKSLSEWKKLEFATRHPFRAALRDAFRKLSISNLGKNEPPK